MTAVEHIVCWIESSQPEYRRLCDLEAKRKRYATNANWNATLALYAFNIAKDAYNQMVAGGDAWAGEHSPATILDAAKALLDWELEA